MFVSREFERLIFFGRIIFGFITIVRMDTF